MSPTLILFEHHGETILSIRGKLTTYIVVGPNEEGKCIAGSLGVPLYSRNRMIPTGLDNLEASSFVQDEFRELASSMRPQDRKDNIPVGYTVIS